MENKILIKDLVKLQILCVRWVERNTFSQCKTHRDMDRIIMGNKLTCTYSTAVDNLYDNIKKYYIISEYILEEISKLKENIANSNIKDLRFGLEPQKMFSDLEKELYTEMIKRKLFMLTDMVVIKEAAEILGLTETAIKQACQNERLLNTTKIGKSWLVHIPECRAYWNIKDEEDNHLYKDYIY